MMPPIDELYAWQIVSDAQAMFSTGPASAGATIAPGLTIAPDGHWQAQGQVSAEAARLFDTLLPLALAGPCWTMAQLGQSIDGRIATESGHSHYVTGEPSRVHLHRLRALVDAVIVGAGTVAADDPQLTVRHADGRNPLRVVVDPSARLALDRKVFADRAAPTLHVVCASAKSPPGVEQLRMDAPAAGIDPATLLAALAERGARRVLVEGGGVTISRFLAADCLDRLHSVVAPLIIGSGRPAISLAPIAHLDAALRPPCRIHPMGEDVLFDFDLRSGPGSPSTST